MVFADGIVFRGMWEGDEWLQSAAEPALCRLQGPGLSGAVAGQNATFSIMVRPHTQGLRHIVCVLGVWLAAMGLTRKPHLPFHIV